MPVWVGWGQGRRWSNRGNGRRLWDPAKGYGVVCVSDLSGSADGATVSSILRTQTLKWRIESWAQVHTVPYTEPSDES